MNASSKSILTILEIYISGMNYAIRSTFIANTWQHCIQRQGIGLIRSIAIREEILEIYVYVRGLIRLERFVK